MSTFILDVFIFGAALTAAISLHRRASWSARGNKLLNEIELELNKSAELLAAGDRKRCDAHLQRANELMEAHDRDYPDHE